MVEVFFFCFSSSSSSFLSRAGVSWGGGWVWTSSYHCSVLIHCGDIGQIEELWRGVGHIQDVNYEISGAIQDGNPIILDKTMKQCQITHFILKSSWTFIKNKGKTKLGFAAKINILHNTLNDQEPRIHVHFILLYRRHFVNDNSHISEHDENWIAEIYLHYTGIK